MGHLDEFSRWPAKRFIETGYGEGRTLAAASQVYSECISIELYEGRYFDAVKKFASQPHVRIFHGNSPDVLKHILDPEISTVFWLDAHYVPADAIIVNGHGLCPILEELTLIKNCAWKEKPVILIDDWSVFRQHDQFGWPRFEELDAIIGAKHQRLPELPGCDIFGYI
jgi:hypothetical protein